MVYCSRKCQIFSSTLCALFQAAVFIVAMLIPYIVLQVQHQGVEKLVTIDRNTYSAKQWNNYVSSNITMSYYIWNATNLHQVLSDSTGSTKLAWNAVGPLVLNKVTQLDIDSGESSDSADPYISFRRVISMNIPDPGTRALLSQPIVGLNTLWLGGLAQNARGLYQQLVPVKIQAQIDAAIQAKIKDLKLNASDPDQASQIQTIKQTFNQNFPLLVNQAIYNQLYDPSLTKESLFYGTLTSLTLSTAAAQFTSLKATNIPSAPEQYYPGSALVPALRILSIGSYLQGAITTLGSDPAIIAYNPQFNLAANPAQAKLALIQAWATGAPIAPPLTDSAAIATSTRLATRAIINPGLANPASAAFLDFELIRPDNTTGPLLSTSTVFSLLWNTSSPLSLVSVTGLKTWGAALLCQQRDPTYTSCSAAEQAAVAAIGQAITTPELNIIQPWIAQLIDAVPGVTPLTPYTARRTYLSRPVPAPGNVTTVPMYYYLGQSPRERFQQVIVSGFGDALNQTTFFLKNFGPALGLTSYAYDLKDYAFAPNVIDPRIYPDQNATLLAAQDQIQTFYDLAILQYATGWVVGFALKPAAQPAPGPTELAGISVSDAKALGSSAGLGADLNLNEPIEFPSAVQLMDPTIPVNCSRLTFKQARSFLKFLQGRDPLTSKAVTPALIGFGLVFEAAIIGLGRAVTSILTLLQNNPQTMALAPALLQTLSPYAHLRTANILEALPIISGTITSIGQPPFTLAYIWGLAKEAVISGAGTTAFTDAMDQALFPSLGIDINTVSIAQFRAVGNYLHTYFRRLQGGVGPDGSLYAINPISNNPLEGTLSSLMLGGAVPQFTALKATGDPTNPEQVYTGSKLIPALRILSIGSYFQAAMQTLGSDPLIIAQYPQLNYTANPQQAAAGFIQFWAKGAPPAPALNDAQAMNSSTRLAAHGSPTSRVFLDFELTKTSDNNGLLVSLSTISALWLDTASLVSFANITGLRTWGAALTCFGMDRTGLSCPTDQAAALNLVNTTIAADLPTILTWLLPLIDAVPNQAPLQPSWRRTYVPITNSLYAYIATTARERFQQVIVQGFNTLLSVAVVPASYGYTASDYAFAPNLPVPASGVAQATSYDTIQSFYDLAILQYATGWIVSLALKPTNQLPGTTELAGISVADSRALGVTAGFEGQLGVTAPVEFSSAVQRVDSTLPVSQTRLSFPQARAFLAYVTGRDVYNGTVTASTVAPALIGFGLTLDALFNKITSTAQGLALTLLIQNQAQGAQFAAQWAPYANSHSAAVLDGLPLLNATLISIGSPPITLASLWTSAKKQVDSTYISAMEQHLFRVLNIDPDNLSTNFRAVADYLHVYFKRLQSGYGINTPVYDGPVATASTYTAQVKEEAYNPAYGVSKRTNGVLIQRTAFEFLFGSRSHISGTETQSIISQTTTLLDEDIRDITNGQVVDGNVIGNQNPIYLSAISRLPFNPDYQARHDAAFARSRLIYTGRLTQVHTGRGDVNKVGLYRAYDGVHRYQSRCQYTNPGNATAQFSNARLLNEQLLAACPITSDGTSATHDPLDWRVFNNSKFETIEGVANDPTQFTPFKEGDNNRLQYVTTFISDVQRIVQLNYTSVVQVKGIFLRRYELDSKYLTAGDATSNPFKNEDYRQSDEPPYTHAAPDGLVNAVWMNSGVPVFISKPHFMYAHPSVTSTWAAGSFQPNPDLHETWIDVDALSGKTFHARKRLQANVEMRRSQMDGSPHLEPLHRNLELYIASGVDASYYIPYYWAEEAGTISDDDADTYVKNIYKARDIAKILQIVGGVFSSIFFVLSVILIIKACTRQPDTTTTGNVEK